MEDSVFDAIVIGAGAAGLMAALELTRAGKRTVLLEARDRAGGRIHTVKEAGFDEPVELGAEFIHGKLEHTLRLLKSAGIGYYELTGNYWQKKNGTLEEQKDFIEDYSLLDKKFKSLDHDISVGHFIDTCLSGKEAAALRFTLKNYVEGYYAGDLDKVSTYALREELNTSDDVQYRIEGGYVRLVKYLLSELQNRGTHCNYNAPVTAIDWGQDMVRVICGDRTWQTGKVLVTVPIGVLQSGQIAFHPNLPEKAKAAAGLGFGPVVKTAMQFSERFWTDKMLTGGQDLDEMSFVFADTLIPTWWTQYPKRIAMITGWSGGPHALALDGLSPEEIRLKGLESLAGLFNAKQETMQEQLRGCAVANWLQEPYSMGAYSYQVVNGSELIRQVKERVQGKLYFAGEGLYDKPEIGTVEAALASGMEVAFEMIAAG